MIRKVLLLLFLLGCGPQKPDQQAVDLLPAQPRFLNDPADLAHKKAAIDSLVQLKAARQGFNGVVLVAHRGQLLYQQAVGIHGYRNKAPLTLEAVFELASVSKQFTAVAVLQLYEQKKLDIDQELQHWWPNFPHSGITPRMLLSHRGGLSNYMYDLDELYRDRSSFIDNKTVLNELISNKFMPFFPPNKRYDYSNTGYVLLACLVEEVSGMSFQKYVAKHIFTPAGMKNSFVFDPKNDQQWKKALQGHSGYFNPITKNYYFNGVVGDKGIYSTVGDLYLWEKALFRHLLLKPETLEMALQPHNPDKKRGANYGFGWRMYDHPAGFQINFHMGWWRGFKSMLVHLPHDESCIIVLSNKTSGAYSLRRDELLDILYGKARGGLLDEAADE